MKMENRKLLILVIFIFMISSLLARSMVSEGANKKLDLVKYHDVGNIWLRVSNYGFFGSGDDITPQWPSLEYPGGSAIDYLYQGALWFGAKKYRRDNAGQKLYWLDDATDADDVIPQSDPEWTSDLKPVIDTLVTVGFDGDWDLYEFLPAYNPLEDSPLGAQYSEWNVKDTIMYSSIRHQRRGVDDDGDGLVDEDPVGHEFPFRESEELPDVFTDFGGVYLSDLSDTDFYPIEENIELWFPLGFVELSEDPSDGIYNFAAANDDDIDGLTDEDGYPVSEQDFISFYYDYSPFGTSGQRDYGSSKSSNHHEPLNVRIRQMSYQWSYEYIKNLVYVEFDITNMNLNPADTLFDCAMGIYMDSDVGPQAWGADERSLDDVSSYVPGAGYEFAYTYDADGDGGLTTGLVGSRVCTPNPEELEFACWYWNRGDGPDDQEPLDPTPSGPTANEKYWLLTNRNPDDSKYISLRDEPESQMDDPDDTRYLFGFYGDQQGLAAPTDSTWNLEPGKTMKIVVGVFPGDDLEDLKSTALFSKLIYGESQNLVEVVKPDTFPHYQAMEPPKIPNTFVELTNNGNAMKVYWDNRSQIDNIDIKNVDKGKIGWQDNNPNLDSHISKYDEQLNQYGYFPDDFAPTGNMNPNAKVNPWTGYRLRHDFQGYAIYGRSGSGSQEQWIHKERWDKVETEQDYNDYMVNYGTDQWEDFGGEDLGIEKGLPQEKILTNEDSEYFDYYHYDPLYKLVNYEPGDTLYGLPLYNTIEYSTDLQNQANGLTFDDQALLFKHANIPERVYLALYDDKLIPLEGHGGQAAIVDADALEELRTDRLSRMYYSHTIYNPPKGIEYYVAVTAWDRGMPSIPLQSLESGRDKDANMKVLFPGTLVEDKVDEVVVVPNPYVGQSKFDGRRENDEKGDKSKRLWFINLPKHCTVRIYTLAGDLVDKFEHNGAHQVDVISVSKAVQHGMSASAIHPWDLLSRNDQIISAGIYLFSVEDHDNDEKKVGKFVIIK